MSDDTKMIALYAALATAQGNFRPIVKNRSVQVRMKSGGTYAFRYADLEEITSATRPALAAAGLSVLHPLQTEDNGKTYMQTILAHKDGGVIASRVELPAPTSYNDPKEFGAASSYLRRYAVSSLLGLAADDDLDENGRDAATGAGADTEADTVGALTEGLIAGARQTTTDADALAFWKNNAAKLAKYPNAFEELKQAVAKHRKALGAATTNATAEG